MIPRKRGEFANPTLNFVRECQDLGIKRTVARGLWEVKTRTGLVRVKPAFSSEKVPPRNPASRLKSFLLPIPCRSASILPLIVPELEKSQLVRLASEATRGRILCFGRWMADFGNPIDWHRDPTTDHRWPANVHWSKVRQVVKSPGEIKFCWEVARFPQAYFFARAAVLDPDQRRCSRTRFIPRWSPSSRRIRGLRVFTGGPARKSPSA